MSIFNEETLENAANQVTVILKMTVTFATSSRR